MNKHTYDIRAEEFGAIVDGVFSTLSIYSDIDIYIIPIVIGWKSLIPFKDGTRHHTHALIPLDPTTKVLNWQQTTLNYHNDITNGSCPEELRPSICIGVRTYPFGKCVVIVIVI